MRSLLLVPALLFALVSAAQNRIERYYDYQWKPAMAPDASFYSVLQQEDSIWHQTDYYIHPGTLQMDGYYLDKEGKVRHGNFRYFHANGKIESIGRYVQNKREGIWLSFHPNGMLADSSFYQNGEWTGTRLSWHGNGMMSDSVVRNPDGSGVSVSWFDNGNPSYAGKTRDGKPTGTWQFFHRNGNKASVEIYEEGRLVNKTYYDEDGHIMADTTNRDHGPVFGKGGKDWQKYVENHSRFPGQWSLKNTDHVTVHVTAVVDEEGNVTDIQVPLPFHPDFDAAAMDVLRKVPRWQPAVSHNRKMRTPLSVYLTFTQD